METKCLGLSNSVRLHLKDLETGIVFLVDSGADISVLSRPKDWKASSPNFKLYAANQTPISVYGVVKRALSFEQNKVIEWQFYMADVAQAILGADALAYYHLLTDLKKQRLIDSFGQVFGHGTTAKSDAPSVTLVAESSTFQTLLKQFPTVIGIADPETVPKEHRVFHRIKTTGPPVAQKARRLSAEKLKAAKLEFANLCKIGHARPSKSPWASPIT